MTGIYLRCDKCGATLGGEEVTDASNGLHWSQYSVLLDAARKLGWTGPLTRQSNSDMCPECSKITKGGKMSETAEMLELSTRARNLDGQVDSLTHQLREKDIEITGLKEWLLEARHELGKTQDEFTEYRRMAKAMIADLDKELSAEKRGRALDVQKAVADGIQARADVMSERDDLRERVESYRQKWGQEVEVRASDLMQYHQTLDALKGSLDEARRELPCGHHHSLDNQAGGCLLCTR